MPGRLILGGRKGTFQRAKGESSIPATAMIAYLSSDSQAVCVITCVQRLPESSAVDQRGRCSFNGAAGRRRLRPQGVRPRGRDSI